MKTEKLNEVLKRCFEGSYQLEEDGELRFMFSDGILESFLMGRHQMALSAGIWYSRPVLFGGNDLYVCSSAMEAVSFAALQNAELGDLEQSSWIVFGLRCQLQVTFPDVFRGRKIHLLFGRDLLDVIRAVQVCVSLKGFLVSFCLLDNYLTCNFRGRSYLFAVEGFSLSRFKQATGFRDYTSMKRPLVVDSFFKQLLLSL